MKRKFYALILASILTASANILVQAEEPAEAVSETVVSGAALTVETESSALSEDCVDCEEDYTDEEASETEASAYITEDTQKVTTEASFSASEETEEDSDSPDTYEAEETDLAKSAENNKNEYITLESAAAENDDIYTENIYYNGFEVVCQWIKNISDSENIIIEYMAEGEKWQNADEITYVTENGFYIKIDSLEKNINYAFRPCYNGKIYKCLFIKLDENGVTIVDPRDVISDTCSLPCYTDASGNYYDFESVIDSFYSNGGETPSPGENTDSPAVPPDKINKINTLGSRSSSKTSGGSVVIGEANKPSAEDIVLSEAPKEEPAPEAPEEPVPLVQNSLDKQGGPQEDAPVVSENIENKEAKPNYTDNSFT